jgi:methylmalonyl-CoA mutase, C-terminal domain
MTDPVRVLLAKPTHDCHDRGVRYVAKKMRDAGFEVIFTNFLLPSEIVNTAVEEDVQVVGVSSSSGGHLPVFEDLIAGLKENGLDDVVLIGGGVIPRDDETMLKAAGVAAIFGPGTTAEDAIALIRERVEGARVEGAA